MANNRAPLYGSGGNIPFVQPVTEERAAYNEVLSMYANATDPISILPSQLRSEVVLGSSTQSFSFYVRADQPNQGSQIVRATENRLDINDAFVARELSIMFGLEAEDADPAAIDWQTFATAAAVPTGFGKLAPAIRAVQNGRLRMLVNSVEYMSGLDLWGMRYVDTAQASATEVSAARKNMAYRSLVPQVRLTGQDKVQFQVDIPTPQDFGEEEGYHVVVGLFLNGLRIANGGGARSID